QFETILPVSILGGRVFTVAGSDECVGIVGNIQRLFEVFVGNPVSIAQLAQEIERKVAHHGKTVRVPFEVPEHVIVFGAQVVVASVFGENQRVEKQAIGVGGQFAEQGAARARQRFLFDITK